jgi:hypothetical protein
MAQTQMDSIGRLRPLILRKSYYALEVLPKHAKAGGLAWASDFAVKPAHEQRAIVYRMITERSRRAARRAGRPDPIWVEAIVKPLDGGGYVLVDTKPLRSEYGGDGRTVENARDEEPRTQDTIELRAAAERIAAQFKERGITIIYQDSNAPDPDPVETLRAIVPKPKRKAS